jgi:hypothetical protein
MGREWGPQISPRPKKKKKKKKKKNMFFFVFGVVLLAVQAAAGAPGTGEWIPADSPDTAVRFVRVLTFNDVYRMWPGSDAGTGWSNINAYTGSAGELRVSVFFFFFFRHCFTSSFRGPCSGFIQSMGYPCYCIPRFLPSLPTSFSQIENNAPSRDFCRAFLLPLSAFFFFSSSFP